MQWPKTGKMGDGKNRGRRSSTDSACMRRQHGCAT